MITNHSISSGFLREKHILKQIPVAHSTLWDWVRDGDFPAPIKLSEKVTVWSKTEIDSWLEAKFTRSEDHIASPEPIDQLGHNGGPPLDDAPAPKVGRKKRGGKNG